MKLIAKIAIPLVIVASLSGCSSSSNDSYSEQSSRYITACPFTAEQMEMNQADQPEIEAMREAVRTGKPNAKMIEDGDSIADATFLLDFYDKTMKNCK